MATNTQHGRTVFVSYSRRDFPFVRDLVADLKRAGYTPWLDLTQIFGGTQWNSRIEDALKECSHCIVVVSPYSMKSAEVRREFEFALQHQKIVIPLLLQTNKLSEPLRSMQWINSRVHYEKALNILLGQLNNTPLNPDDDPLEAPPLPISFFGFVPIFYIACPVVVKTVTALIFLSGFLKMFFGCFLSISGSDDEKVIAGCEILVVLFWMWWAFRAASRRSTLIEMATLGVMVVVSPLFGLVAESKVFWPLTLAPLDLAALVIILKSRPYRRWMTTYSVGWGRIGDA